MTLAPGTPVVVFGDDWGRNVSTIQHVFRWIIPDYPVVWVNGIGHRKPGLGTKDMRRAGRKILAMFGASQKTEALVGGAGYPNPVAVVQPKVLPWHDRPWIYAYNVRAMQSAIQNALAESGLAGRQPLLITGSPPSVGLIGRLGELASIYYCLDDYMQLPSVTPEMIGPLETALLHKVDAVVCTAQSLARSKVPRSGRAYYLPQGVNYDHMARPQPLPSDLASLPSPIIGFAGAVYERCDAVLIRAISAAFPHGSIVLIGPVQMDTAALTAPNVHVLGPRPYASLPAYVQGFDVGIIPYVINAETVAVDPLKLLEYCAAGIPCVATALPEARKYSSVVSIAASTESFIAAIADALRGDPVRTRERGQELAKSNTWKDRAEALLRIAGDEVARRRGSIV